MIDEINKALAAIKANECISQRKEWNDDTKWDDLYIKHITYLLDLVKRQEAVAEAASKYVNGHPYSNFRSEDNGVEERNWDVMCNAVYNLKEGRDE